MPETAAGLTLREAAQAVVEHRTGRHGIVHFWCGIEFDDHIATLRATLDARSTERLTRYTAMVNVNGAVHFVTDDEGKWVLFSQVAALRTPVEEPHA